MAKKKKKGTCKLCLKSNVELVRGHIIPDWAYSGFGKQKVSIDLRSRKRVNTEIRERLMCEPCDGKIGLIEGAFKDAFFASKQKAHKAIVLVSNERALDRFELTGLSFMLAYRFAHAICLKMHWSTKPLWKDFRLPDEYIECIRKFLYSDWIIPMKSLILFQMRSVIKDGENIARQVVRNPSVRAFKGPLSKNVAMVVFPFAEFECCFLPFSPVENCELKQPSPLMFLKEEGWRTFLMNAFCLDPGVVLFD